MPRCDLDPTSRLARQPTARDRARHDDHHVLGGIFNRCVPTYHVHNDCDIAGICPNGELLRSQLQRIRVLFTDVIIDSSMQQVSACLDACGTNPDGDTRFEDNPRGFTEGSRNHTLPASATYTPPAPTATPVGMKSCPAPEP